MEALGAPLGLSPSGCRIMTSLISVCHCVGRKYELYSMDWDLKEELRDCLVAAAPYGGPIGKFPLWHCMLWDRGMNLGSLLLGGSCWHMLPTPTPPY